MKVALVGVFLLLALVTVAMAAGKWIERINEEFQDAENRDNE